MNELGLGTCRVMCGDMTENLGQGSPLGNEMDAISRSLSCDSAGSAKEKPRSKPKCVLRGATLLGARVE